MIIGITGTLGAGKGTIANYLVEQKGFIHFSARSFIVEEIKRRGLVVDRNSMIEVGNDLRQENGSAYVIEELYRQAIPLGKDSILESIRTVGEVKAMKNKKDFYLLAVDANITIRYKRIIERASSSDQVDFEEFKSQEEREMSSADPNRQNLAECIRLADYVINNDGTIYDLNKQVEEILQKITNQKHV